MKLTFKLYKKLLTYDSFKLVLSTDDDSLAQVEFWLYRDVLGAYVDTRGKIDREAVFQWLDRMGIERPKINLARSQQMQYIEWYQFEDDSLWKLLENLIVI